MTKAQSKNFTDALNLLMEKTEIITTIHEVEYEDHPCVVDNSFDFNCVQKLTAKINHVSDALQKIIEKSTGYVPEEEEKKA